VRIWQLTVDDMKVRPAHTAGGDLDANLTRSWLQIGKLGPLESRPNSIQHHRVHCVLHVSGNPEPRSTEASVNMSLL
jgi:hypothetical protein